MNRSTPNLFLAAICIAVCWAGAIPSRQERETKDNCQSYFQGNTYLPCWLLGGKCYCFSTNANSVNRLDWKTANQECRKEGMGLLSLESQEEDMLINNHIKVTSELMNDYYWTSGRYSQEGKNRWEWATTEPFPQMSYTNWYPGYPNNSQPGSYAYINYNFPTGYWFNENNLSYILFICESMGGSVSTEAPTSTAMSSATPTMMESTITTLNAETTPEELSTITIVNEETTTEELSTTESTTSFTYSTVA